MKSSGESKTPGFFIIPFLYRLLSNTGIRTKLIVSFFLAVFIPVIILGMIFINKLVEISTNHTIREFLISVERLEKNTSEVLKKAKDLSDRFYIDKTLQAILIKKFDSLLELTEVLNAYTEFDYFAQLHDEIESVRVYTTNPTIKENWRFMKAGFAIRQTVWYKNALEKNGKPFWSNVREDGKINHSIRLSRLIPSFEGMPDSVLIVDIKNEAFRYMQEQEVFTTLLILDYGREGEKTIISYGGSDISRETVRDFVSASARQPYKTRNTVMIHNKSFYRISRQLNDPDFLASFSIEAFFPMDKLDNSRDSMMYLGLIMILICLVFSNLLLFILSNHLVSRRIRFLSAGMHRIAEGDLDVSVRLEGNDEIGQLSHDITRMIESLKNLVGKVYKADLQKKQFELKQKDMEFKLLASQVNPHFFFNALEAIRAKALSSKIDELGDIIKALGKIMRRSLEISHDPVSLGSEISFIISYLDIQKYRFEHRLQYEIRVNEELNEYKLIPHLLQPVVENAIIHGIEKKITPGLIIIKAEVDNAESGKPRIILSITDDGIGIERDKLMSIRKALRTGHVIKESVPELPAHGIGLINVHERIRLYYGKPYGVRIFSRKNQKTRIDITLPYPGVSEIC